MNRHELRRALVVMRGHPHAQVPNADFNGRLDDRFTALDQFGRQAPRQELRIVLDALDQLKHAVGRMRDDGVAPDLTHGRTA
jgi:hypothetical protein